MTHRDVDVLRSRLAAIVAAATTIARHAEDLHGLAYERAVRDNVKVSRSGVADIGTVGDPRLRDLWTRLFDIARTVEIDVVGLERSMMNVLAAGPSPEPSRGSLIPKSELRRRLKNQAKQGGSPEKLVPQPVYPGTTAT